MDPWLILKSMSVGLAIAAPVGPMSLLCIERTLRGGQPAGLRFGAGIAAGDLTYAALGAFGITAVTGVLLAGAFWIRLAGCLLIALLGVRIALAPPADLSGNDGARTGGPGFLTAYGLTLANPPTILYFAGMFASLSGLSTAAQSLTFSLGVFAGSMLWIVLLTTLVARGASRLTPPVMRWINRASGAVLVAWSAWGLLAMEMPS